MSGEGEESASTAPGTARPSAVEQAILELQASQTQIAQALQALSISQANIAQTMARPPVSVETTEGTHRLTKERGSKPSKFDGKLEDALNFTSSFSIYLDLNSEVYPTDKSKAQLLMTCCDGGPLTWMVNHITEVDMPEFRFKDLWHDFSSVYIRVDLKSRAEQELSDLKQGHGSVANYIAKFSELSAIVGSSETDQRMRFQRGLNPKLKEVLYLWNPADLQTIRDWYQGAGAAEDRLRELGRWKDNWVPRSGPSTSNWKARVAATMPQQDNQRPRRDMSTTQCYNCQQYGHMANKCRNPKVPRSFGPRVAATTQPADSNAVGIADLMRVIEEQGQTLAALKDKAGFQ